MAKVKKRKFRLDRLALLIVSFAILITLIWLALNMIFFSDKKPAGDPSGSDNPAVEKGPFEVFYYYEADKLSRYEAYQALHPEMSADTVVWHVNSNLDKEFYSEITTISDVNTKPLLVNKYYALPSDYVPSNMVAIGNGKYMDETAYAAFQEMQAAAAEEGYQLSIVSAYRSYDYQKSLYSNYLSKYSQEEVDTFSARPGHSEHQTGLAIDICGANGDYLKFEDTDEEAWVTAHAHEYGFIIRYGEDIVDLTGYKYEPWHLRYVGVDVAQKMKDEGIRTLEEYIVKYVENKGE